MLLSRLATSLGQDVADDCLLIPARRITKIFVWSDVITFWIQAAGGGISIQAKLSSFGTKVSYFVLCYLVYYNYSLLKCMLLARDGRVNFTAGLVRSFHLHVDRVWVQSVRYSILKEHRMKLTCYNSCIAAQNTPHTGISILVASR